MTRDAGGHAVGHEASDATRHASGNAVGDTTRHAKEKGRPWMILVAFLLPLALYFLGSERPPHPDELYHILAARGINDVGEPRIAEGYYVRGIAYTQLIAASLSLFGDSLISARLPSMLAMAAVVALLFGWLCRQSSLQAAVLGAGLFAISPFAIEIAQFARFYGAQTLCFLAGSLIIYQAFQGRDGHRQSPVRRWWWLSLPFFALAGYFQLTTLIGAVGLVVWVALQILADWRNGNGNHGTPRRIPVRWLFAALAAALLLAGLAVQLGIVETLWSEYRSVSLFNKSRADQFWYYHLFYSVYYPSLWPAIGVLSVAAVAWRPRPALFCITVFAFSFLINSFAAPKSLRYIIYAQPFLFAIFGMGMAGLWIGLRNWYHGLRPALASATGIDAPWDNRLASAAIGGALLFLLLGNAFFLKSATLLANVTIPPDKPPINWALSQSALQPELDKAAVIVTQAELPMLYYHDHYDILLSASRLGENPGAGEFDPDFRTGRAMISQPESMQRVFDCFDSGLFVTTRWRWTDEDYISAEMVSLIEANTYPVPLPEKSGVLAFAWSRAAAESDLSGAAGSTLTKSAEDCKALAKRLPPRSNVRN